MCVNWTVVLKNNFINYLKSVVESIIMLNLTFCFLGEYLPSYKKKQMLLTQLYIEQFQMIPIE